jgi:hypothetical protein
VGAVPAHLLGQPNYTPCLRAAKGPERGRYAPTIVDEDEIRLASEPKIERWGDAYALTFELEGAMPFEDLVRPLELRDNRARLFDSTVVIHGVWAGGGTEAVEAVKDSIAEVNEQRRKRRAQAERERPAQEEGQRKAEEELEQMRQDVRAAWEAA